MTDFMFCLAKPFLHALDPEDAHKVTILSLKTGVMPRQRRIDDPRLRMTLWNLAFENPVGIAAGFDKNAEVIGPMFDMGAGFAEAGTVTPKPQAGNPKPRLFRNPGTRAVINRMGFPNQGVDVFKRNLERFYARPAARSRGLVGLNIGMNKDQANPVEDYCLLVRELAPYADYFAVNISSPNTPGLRDMQTRETFLKLTEQILAQRAKSCPSEKLPPVLVKLAPDLTEAQQEDLAGAALESGVEGLILTNTTLDRPETLPEDFRKETGGLSGEPLTQKSTDIIRNFYDLTHGKLPIMGVGGISSAQDAYDKIRAGASVLQLYSALVFQGPELIKKINTGLLDFLERDGFKHLSEAVGADHAQASRSQKRAAE